MIPVQEPASDGRATGRKLVSIVVPVLNEQDNIRPVYDRVCSVMGPLAERYDFEIVFTDNHSTDDTFTHIRELAAEDPRVRGARFSRNFGYQRSIWTGYVLARGDAAIQLDGDLQDPPELIPSFLAAWEDGYKVVYGVRRTRREGRMITAARRGFYRLLAALSEDEVPVDAGDFRLVDRVVLDQLAAIKEAQPYLRGSIASLGFSQLGIDYDRAARDRGESKFSFGDMLALALDGILSHSVVPLRVATYLGLIVAVMTVIGLIAVVIGKLILRDNWPAGVATIWVLILLSISLNALFLGVIGEYIGRIYKQVKPRPITVIEDSVGVPAHRESDA